MIRIGLAESNSIIHTVVSSLASQAVKAVEGYGICLFKRSEVNDLHTGGFAKGLEIRSNALSLDVHTLIGAECGKDLGLKTALSDLLMILEGIGRIVGGAKKINIGVANEVLGTHLGRSQLLGGDSPDLLAVFLADNQVAIEVTLKLKVAPVIQRIADQLGHYATISLEAIKVGSVTGDVLFINAAGAHSSPLIVVAVKPYLGDVGIALILCDLSGGKVAVIVDDGKLFRIVVEKDPRGLGRKEKISIHKLLHNKSS
jgi:hypothetical protein